MRFRFGLIILFSVSVLGSELGCGQLLTGTYTGTEAVSFTGATIAQSPIQTTLSLTQTNNDVLSGSIQSGSGSGTLTGPVIARPSGEISVVTSLTSAFPGTQAVNITPAISATAALACGTYTGKLTFTPTLISGKLDLTVPAAVPSGIPLTSITAACPSTRTINATR